MKLKKIIIGLFATIGVLSVLACLVGIGYLAGSSTSIPELLNIAKPATGSPEVSTENTETLNENVTGNTDLGTLISADRGSSTGNIVSNITPTPGGTQGSTQTPSETPSDNPTTSTEFAITEEDFYYDTNGHIQYTLELIDYIKSFENYSNYDNYQISMIIESEPFKQMFNMGKTLGDIQGTLASELSEDATHDFIKKRVPALHFDFSDTTQSDPAGNSGYGDTSQVPDSNQGGTDENERTPEDEQQGTDMSDTADNTDNTDNPDTNPSQSGTNNEASDTPGEVIINTNENTKYTHEIIQKWMYATDAVNTRKGPSTDYEKTGNLTKGQQVWVAGRCNETGWYMILQGDQLVYVTDKYISETPPATPTPVPTATPKPEAKPTETPSQNTGSSSETTKPEGTKETQTIKFTYKGLDENNNEVTYEEELTVQGSYIDGYFIPDGLDEKVGYGFPYSGERVELNAWREKYPNLEYVYVKEVGKTMIFPAGYETQKGNYNGDGLNAH